MRNNAKQFFLMPVLGVLVLACGAVDLAFRPSAGDARWYHGAVHEASLDGVPEIIDDWTWNRNTVFPTEAANQLLKPNVLIQREYRQPTTGRSMVFLLDQCPDAENMNGHYPPVCYAGQGLVLTGQLPVTLQMRQPGEPAMPIEAMTYVFNDKTQDTQTLIFNFMILPSGRFLTDIDDVRRAAADFSQRFYGAAQLQFVFALPQHVGKAELEDARQADQKVVETFLAATSPLLKLIYKGGRP